MSKRKQILLTCNNCGLYYSKDLSEFRRNRSLDRASFCSRKCQLHVRQGIGTRAYAKKAKGMPPPAQFSNKSDELSPFRCYITHAKRRGKEFNLTLSYLRNLWFTQKGLCKLTNLPIILKSHKTTSKELGLTTASLDRIDSNKGYVEGNVQFVCVGINLAKGDRSDAEMEEFVRLLRGDNFNYEPTLFSLRMAHLIKLA